MHGSRSNNSSRWSRSLVLLSLVVRARVVFTSVDIPPQLRALAPQRSTQGDADNARWREVEERGLRRAERVHDEDRRRETWQEREGDVSPTCAQARRGRRGRTENVGDEA